MRFTTRLAAPLLILGALIPLYALLLPLGLAPDFAPHYGAIVVLALLVWVASSFIAFGFSIFNELDAIRRMVRIQRLRGNGSARIVAEWYIKKHTYLLVGAGFEIALWALALTGPAGSGANAPNLRGVLYVLLFDGMNLVIALIATGSTIVTRLLGAYVRNGGRVEADDLNIDTPLATE